MIDHILLALDKNDSILLFDHNFYQMFKFYFILYNITTHSFTILSTIESSYL